ncbi:microbial serine ase [Fusarium beomiforme]|uniref:Microbial serine ase n=1 Tax=Fusarium beomiforme TaxID=44412 RepID=A0A9P5AFT9_9HYPO|nr:microbial serine ase [Fusarium beomiforme]
MTKVTFPTDGRGADSDDDYKDDDFEDEPAKITYHDEVRAAFENITNEARDRKLNLGRRENRDIFLQKYGHLLGRTTKDTNQTLLHMIANTVGHKSLTRCVIKFDKTLLHRLDDSSKTPLHIAIVKKNSAFISVVLDEIEDLDSLLRVHSEHKRNCIHTAICYNLPHESTIDLIRKASEETLRATDQSGLTPLHLAVDYKYSSEAQLKVVEALLHYGDSALDIYSKEPPNQSVYEYQNFTQQSWRKQFEGSASARNGDRKQEDSREGSQGQDGEHIGSRPKGGSEHVNLRSRGPQQLGKDGHAGLNRSPETIHSRDSDLIDAGSRHVTVSTGGPRGAESGRTPIEAPDGFKPLQRKQTGVEDAAKQAREEEGKSQWAEKIRHAVKLHYLRTTLRTNSESASRTQLKAVRFLHGANLNNINLCFDYSEAPPEIFEDSFIQSYDHINFDPILRYVSFRRIELQKPAVSVVKARLLGRNRPQTSNKGRGRDDLTVFFKWLKGKGVKHILKVMVDDLKDPAHSDQAIEDCLRPFEVEILDWTKVDLCPETILTASRNVRQLHLRWSGNRAILRAWSEPEGLAKLEKLEAVHLVYNEEQALESADRIDMYVEDFKERLNESAAANNKKPPPTGEEKADQDRSILVFRCKADVPGSERIVREGAFAKAQSGINEMSLQSNRWLNTMDKFADELQNTCSDFVKPQHGIKVALIDDGADPYVESLRGKIRGGETFSRGFPHENGPSPYYRSTKGHGTVMADNICRASLDLATQTQGQEYIAAESAALAVRAAIDQKVDIISMSWTVRKTADNRDGINAFAEAIKDALDAGILLFCAAADTGAVTEVEYPWSFDKQRIFRIGAATADGRVWGPTGNPQNLSFILPGHKVVSRNPHREGALPDDFEERTGSSVATALASGLAALILHCVRLAIVHREKQGGAPSPTAVSDSDLERLTNHDDMYGVLRGIGLDEGQQRFIEVWRRFERPAQELKAPGMNQSMEALGIVARLARDLVPSASS